MRDALPPSPDGYPRRGLICQACGRTVVITVEGLFDNPTRGSHQRFCSPSCRQAAFRRRRAGAAEDEPRQLTGGRDRHLTNRPQHQAEGSNFNRR